MSSVAAQSEYADDRLDFIAEMRENGRVASFGTRSRTGSAWDPNGDYVETGEAGVFPSEWKKDFSNDVQSDDLFFFVGAELDAEQCTVMLDDGVEYTVRHVKPFKPDDLVIFYEVQVRI